LNWLSNSGGISSDEVTAIVEYSERERGAQDDTFNVPIVSFDRVKTTLTEQDIVIVASELFDETVGELFSCGVRNIFNGDLIVQRQSPAQRFLSLAADLYLGPGTPAPFDPDRDDFDRYTSEPIEAHNIPKHKLFVVNSMPKSGTLWMMAMLEGLLGVKAKEQITLSHVRDIETDWPKRNNHGAVTLVRDLRDVVVSWFHHMCRSDLQNGFASPRYPTIEEFYFEYFIGELAANPRYYSGDLGRWLDFVSKQTFPIVKYESLVVDTQSALRKVMNFWKVTTSDRLLAEVVRNYSFANMRRTVSTQTGYVSDALAAGHMRLGKTGSWENELPAEIADDINQRFSCYQTRLRYI